MTKSTGLPWQQPQPKPVGFEDRPRRDATRGRSFRLVLEPIEGPRYSVVAVVALLIAIGLFVAFIAIEVSGLLLRIGGAIDIPFADGTTILVLAGIALVTVVLGHVGLHQVQLGVRRGLVMSGFTLGVGYVLLVVELLTLLGGR